MSSNENSDTKLISAYPFIQKHALTDQPESMFKKEKEERKQKYTCDLYKTQGNRDPSQSIQ